MSTRFASRILVMTFLAAGLASAVHASSIATVMVGGEYRTWEEQAGTSQDRSISQGGGVLTLGLRLASVADLVVSNSGAWSKAGLGASNVSLAGFGALSSALFVHLDNDRLLLKLTATAPSGKTRLDDDDLLIVEALGHPLLGFGLRHYGTGFEVGGSTTWGLIEAQSHRLTIGGGGLVRGPYRLFKAAPDFHAAAEWAMTTGFEMGMSGAQGGAPVRIDLTYRDFGTDRLGAIGVYREGAQLEMLGQGVADRSPFYWTGTVRGVLKSDNRILAPPGSAVADFKASSGDLVGILLSVDRALGSGTRLGLLLEDNVLAGSDASGRNGNVIGIGEHLAFPLGSGMSLRLSSQYWWGRVDAVSGGPRHDFHGVSVGMQLRWDGNS